MSAPIILDQVVDGFSYNTNLLYLPNRYWPNALAQLDILRRANNLRARWWCVPDDIDEPIAAYSTSYFQTDTRRASSRSRSRSTSWTS